MQLAVATVTATATPSSLLDCPYKEAKAISITTTRQTRQAAFAFCFFVLFVSIPPISAGELGIG